MRACGWLYIRACAGIDPNGCDVAALVRDEMRAGGSARFLYCTIYRIYVHLCVF
jgi:hypothetical protein